MKEELPIPQETDSATKAMELIRIWLIDKNQYTVVTPNLWKDPATWGLLFVDVIKHIAKSYESERINYEEALSRIKAGFDAEWDSATNE